MAPLASNWEEFYATKRSGATRRRDRSKRKRLEANGDIRFIEPQTPHERSDTLETPMRQKAFSCHLLELPRYADLYRAVSAEPIAHVSRLDIGGHAGAINLG